jgi:hypothetical protein
VHDLSSGFRTTPKARPADRVAMVSPSWAGPGLFPSVHGGAPRRGAHGGEPLAAPDGLTVRELRGHRPLAGGEMAWMGCGWGRVQRHPCKSATPQVGTGGPPGDRTQNPRIKSPLLCRLS